MHTPQLFIEEISAAAGGKTYQKVTASGPGNIDILDKKTLKRHQHAFWEQLPRSARKTNMRVLPRARCKTCSSSQAKDLRFVDDEQHQSLRADTLKVWHSPGDKPVEKATPAQAVGADPAAGGSCSISRGGSAMFCQSRRR